MPQKRKSNLSRNPSRARAAKIARTEEYSVHAELRRQQQAKRQCALRAGETTSQRQERLKGQTERQAALRAVETPVQTRVRLDEQAERQTNLRASETPLQTQLRLDRQADQQAAEMLLKIGDGCLGVDAEGYISLSREFCSLVENGVDLIAQVFPDLQQNLSSDQWLCARAILAPKNVIVNRINTEILKDVQGEMKEYLSIDTVMDTEQRTSYPAEFLNSLELSDAPRLCNGTRLRITQLGQNILGATILTGVGKGESVIIPRIPIIPTDLPFQFKRVQFSVRLSFAITINKSQGQTLAVAGAHLEKPCFSHGQLYVACSRVSSARNLHVFAPDGKTYNVVYSSILT